MHRLKPNLTTGTENPEKLPLVGAPRLPYPSGNGGSGANRPPEKEGNNAACISQVFDSRRHFKNRRFADQSTGAENPIQEEKTMNGQSAAGGSSVDLGLHIMHGINLVVAITAPPFPGCLDLWASLRRCPEFEGFHAVLCRRSPAVSYLPAPRCLVGRMAS